MNLSVFIARRYLFAKKSQNVINIISAISLVGVVLGTMALIVVLSVFNGFEDLTKSLYNTFDSDLKIVTEKGKTFRLDSTMLIRLSELSGVERVAQVVEENVLIDYNGRQAIAVMKGVDSEFERMTKMHEAMYSGSFKLHLNNYPVVVLGRELASRLGVGVRSFNPLYFYVPRRDASSSSLSNPAESLNVDQAYFGGGFAIEKTFDETYAFVPIEFVRELLDYTDEVSAIEIMLNKQADAVNMQKQVAKLLPDGLLVKNRLQQNVSLYRMMRSEKTMIYSILVFIVFILSFNITGSLFMLIIDKKKDITTFRNIGATNQLIRRIFLYEGWFISLFGMAIGLLLGILLCWLQQHFGLLTLPEGMLVSAYPVVVKWFDVVLVVASVGLIGYLAAWIAVRSLSKQLMSDSK